MHTLILKQPAQRGNNQAQRCFELMGDVGEKIYLHPCLLQGLLPVNPGNPEFVPLVEKIDTPYN